MRRTPCRCPSRTSATPSSAEECPVARTRLCLAMSAITSLTAGRSSPPLARDADEGTAGILEPHGIFGVEGGHPDEPPVAAGHLRHVLDRRRIDPANGQVEVDPAEDLDAGHRLADDVGQARGGLVVVLEHDRPHAASLRKAGGVDTVERPGPAVGKGVDVDVDGPAEGVRQRCGSAGAARLAPTPPARQWRALSARGPIACVSPPAQTRAARCPQCRPSACNRNSPAPCRWRRSRRGRRSRRPSP